MLKLTAETMTAAIARAKTVRPKVKVISANDRTYAVTGSKGDVYTVKFAVANSHKLAECNCPARGMCFHIAAAASVNIGIQSMRRTVESQPVATRDAIIADIKATWPKDVNLADALMARFKVNYLEALSVDFLTAIRATIA